MLYRTTRSHTISNDEIALPAQSRSIKFFQHDKKHPLHVKMNIPLPLYLACKDDDLVRVESCLKKIKRDEIDYQYLPNNETALHVATRNQNKEIIQALLAHGAQRSLRNVNGRQAYELAETQDIKDLFKRHKTSRFGFLHNFYRTNSSSSQKIKCDSCSLVNDSIFYEWEMIDKNASEKALRFRCELKSSTLMNDKDFKQKLHSIIKGYVEARIRNTSTDDGERIHNYFERAVRQQNPYYILTAYTICQNFSKLLNQDMARNVIHDLKNGCSKFSCDCLYSTEDGTKSITRILLNHPTFQKRNFKGEVYRGIVVPKHTLDHYQVGSCIITTTFLSTSKNPAVAQIFCDKSVPDSDKQGFFCIYEIVDDYRTALDISRISEFEDEDEVLILPYSAFLITKIEQQDDEITNIYLKEQCLKHMFEKNELLELAIKSSVHLLELIGGHLLNNTNETPLEKDDIILRPRSKTISDFDTKF